MSVFLLGLGRIYFIFFLVVAAVAAALAAASGSAGAGAVAGAVAGSGACLSLLYTLYVVHFLDLWLFHMFWYLMGGMIVRSASVSRSWPRPTIPLRRSLRYIYPTPLEQQGLFSLLTTAQIY